MSTLLKEAPPPGYFRLPGVHGAPRLWNKVVPLGVVGSSISRAPLSPSRFAAELSERSFTNGADREVVVELCASRGVSIHGPPNIELNEANAMLPDLTESGATSVAGARRQPDARGWLRLHPGARFSADALE